MSRQLSGSLAGAGLSPYPSPSLSSVCVGSSGKASTSSFTPSWSISSVQPFSSRSSPSGGATSGHSSSLFATPSLSSSACEGLHPTASTKCDSEIGVFGHWSITLPTESNSQYVSPSSSGSSSESLQPSRSASRAGVEIQPVSPRGQPSSSSTIRSLSSSKSSVVSRHPSPSLSVILPDIHPTEPRGHESTSSVKPSPSSSSSSSTSRQPSLSKSWAPLESQFVAMGVQSSSKSLIPSLSSSASS